ncbi:Zinc finger C2H2 [Penicillium riverlandense]|uniref:Zinc finger C2H2 n=1 Tax=Penicillium riverlandense TaxID=1903569 RepID=UPI0025470BC8|nr:Zinc finger C2H2 [Penicillium riverlandense]KAJ5811311.1 Zinc finger C2H2 [Penicillium riverlandense]
MGRTRGSFQQSSSRGPPLPEGTRSIEMTPPYSSPVSTTLSQRESLTQGVGLGISTRGMDTPFNHSRACASSGHYSMAPPLHNQLVPSGTIYYDFPLNIGGLSNDQFREVYNSCATTSDSPISLYSAQTLSASPSYNSALELPSNQELFSNQPSGLWATTIPCSRTTTPNEVVAADEEAKSHWCRNVFTDRLVPPSASMSSAANSSFSPTILGEETDSRQMVTQPQGPAADNGASSPSNSSRRSRVSSPADKPSEVDIGLKCPICGAKFTRKSNCREHQKKHDPEFKKMYTCDTCGRSFRRGTDLRRHADSVSEV